MANLNFITSNLATGGDLPEASLDALRDIEEWRSLGITHVVDNRMECNDTDLVAQWAPEIRYLHNGVDDAGQLMPDAWFDVGVAFVRAAFNDPGAKVLVHCHMGINRGPSLAYAVLLATGWDPVDAMAAIRTVRPIAGIGYAQDALEWHHRTQHIPKPLRLDQCRRLDEWRAANWIDIVRIIRGIRAVEAH